MVDMESTTTAATSSVSSNSVQVITDELDYNRGFESYIKTLPIYKDHGDDYRTVAVIGCQSSGKSKLA